MSTPYLLFDYLPQSGTPPAPSLLAWLAADQPSLYGLGVQPGATFDPLPFVSAFPGDAKEVWIFAEWADALNTLLRDGASATELRAWLGHTQTPAIREREYGAANRLEDMVSQLATGDLVRKPSALEGLFFVLARDGGPSLRIQRAQRPEADFVVTDRHGQVMALVELKRALRPATPSTASSPSWPILVRKPTDRSMMLITALTAPDYQQRLQAWLDSLTK